MLSGTSIEEQIWNYFKGKGFNDYGIAGVMGNMYSESGLNPKNLQNTYNNILEMSDDKYTSSVDNGTYKNFIRDGAGYGLAQWTYWSRKQGLLNLKHSRGCSIGDLELQLDYFYKELNESYNGVLYVLKTALTILESSNAVLLQYERPANQSEAMQKKRAAFSQVYYDKFATTEKKGGDYIMSNSPLVVYTKISPNRSSPRNHIIDTITIHCVVGQCRIETLGEHFANKERRGSSNYGVDKDGRIGLFVEEKDRSWCSNSSSNDNRAITIEVASDTFHPYAVTDKAYNSLIDLCVDICKRNKIKELKWKTDKSLIGQIDKQNMTVHRWFANKACPGDYLYNRHGVIADEVNKRLNNKNNKMEDEDMDVKKFHELWLEMREELKDNDSASWSQEARDWSIENGLIQGGNYINNKPNYMWEDIITREQFITVLYRFAQMMGRV